MSELRECPFCDHLGAVPACADTRDGREWWAVCSNWLCEATGPERKTKRGAIAAWNRRHKEKTDDE